MVYLSVLRIPGLGTESYLSQGSASAGGGGLRFCSTKERVGAPHNIDDSLKP